MKPGSTANRSSLTTTHFGRAWTTLDEATSTIDVAQAWLREGAPHGTVVTAGRQTLGRGRQGRGWSSPSGGLWISIIVRPDLDPAKVGRLGLVLAVAGAEACEAVTGVPVGLKWPNDLTLHGRKLGGVLITSTIEGARISSAILSIGINVNVRREDLPEDVRDLAAILHEQTGREIALPDLAVTLLNKLEASWPEVTGDGTGLLKAWSARDILVGREVSVTSAGKILRGRSGGVDVLGRLKLVLPGGAVALATGEITFVRETPG